MNTAPTFAPRNGVAVRALPMKSPDSRRSIRIWWREIDRVLLVLILALMALGALAVAASSPASAQRLSAGDVRLDDLHFFWLHMRWQVLGLAVLIGTSFVEGEWLRRGAIMLAAAMLLALILVPFVGAEVNGARRWLKLGLSLQPSEFLKPAFVMTVAWILSLKIRDPDLPVTWVTGSALGLIVALLMLQPDLGSSMLFIGAWFVMVMVAGLPLQRIGVLCGFLMVLLMGFYLGYENGRNRIDAFFGGGSAYDQVDLASRTLMGGGWTGSGLWLGTNKMRLPEAHTDYIFSVIGEEFGLLICAVVVLLYLAIVLRVLVRLVKEDRLFNILAASGLIALFGGQAFINILVNLQLFPSKGMTLPLVSYGGSSTIAICFTIGLLLAVTRRNPFVSRDKLDLRGSLEKEAAS